MVARSFSAGVRGIRQGVPGGYALGRASGARGPVSLLPFNGVIGSPAASAIGAAAITAGGSVGNVYAPAFTYATASNETVTSTYPTFLMLGLGFTYTPTKSGALLIAIQGSLGANAVSLPIVQAAYGTGTAPVNGAAATGTIFANSQQAGFNVPAINDRNLANLLGFITSLTVGTAYWFDLQGANINAGDTCFFDGASITIVEF